MNTTPTRNGKIARLPRHIRTRLNQRLDNGEPHTTLVAWLNQLPEVKAVLAQHFEGKAIRPQNLSEWKQGGYRDWQLQQDALEIAARLQEDAQEAQTQAQSQTPPHETPSLSDALGHWLATRLTLATRHIAEAKPEESWSQLRQFSRELATLRRSDHQAQRLRLHLERAAVQREREKARAEAEAVAKAAEPPKDPYAGNTAKIAAMRKAFFHDIDNLELELPE